MIFQKLIQKFSTLPDKSSLQNHSSSPLFLSLSPNPKFSPLRIQFHTRKRNQRITPANFFPQRVSIRERFESAPYKIPSGQLRSPSEIRNDPPSKNPPHFITVVHLPRPSPTFSSGGGEEGFRGGGWRFFTAPPPIITSSTRGVEFPLTVAERKTESCKSFRIHFHSATRALEGFTQFLPNYPCQPGHAHNCPLGLINSSAGLHPPFEPLVGPLSLSFCFYLPTDRPSPSSIPFHRSIEL